MTPTAATAIVGGGWLGSALARAIDPPVVVTTRSGTWRGGRAPPGVRVAALDVTAGIDTGARLEACTEVFSETGALAGIEALVIAYAPGGGQHRRTLYVEGTRRLLEALAERPLRRVVHLGSTSALPDVDGWVDETCDAWPETERGRVQREAEQVVAEICHARGWPHLTLRLGGLYGPGRPLGAIDRWRSDDPLPGDGNVSTNLVHLDDAVAAVVAALRAPPQVRGVIHVCADDHTPRRELYARVARRLGTPEVRWSRPADPGASPRGKKACNRAMKEVLGVTLHHPRHVIDEVATLPDRGS